METDRDIQQLLNVIPGYPGLRIMHFANKTSALIDNIAEICLTRDYEYQIQCMNDTLTKEFQSRYPHPNIRAKHILLSQPRYHIQAKMYDFVFVEAVIDDKIHFVKTVYTAMKNAGNIFVLHRHNKQDEEKWRQAFEENFFVAFSAFDLNEQTRIISAKKMHGWGG